MFLCGIAVTVLFSLLYIFEPPFFRFLELRCYDTIIQENPTDRSATDIVIVDIDENSLREFGQWPWPRYLVARLLKKIQEQGAATVGVDLLFAEADRTSLGTVLKQVKETDGSSTRHDHLPPASMNNDRLLANTLRTGPFVLARKFLFHAELPNPEESVLHPLSVVMLGAAGSNWAHPPFYKASAVVCNLSMFDSAVTASGFINAPFDIDGLLRRIPLIIQYDEGQGPEFFPSLVLATIMKHKGLKQVFVRIDSSGKPLEILLGKTAIPVDGIGNMLIHYDYQDKPFPYVSAADLLSGRPLKTSMQGKIIFVGTSATGLGERRITPVQSFQPAVEIHATAAQNILQASFVQRPAWISGLELFFVLFTGVFSTFLFIRTNAKWSVAFLLVISAGLWSVSILSFRSEGMILSPLIPLLTVASNFSLLNLSKFWISERALRLSESNYRSIFDNAIEGICQITPEGEIVAANKALAHMMGFDTPAAMLAAMPQIRSIRFENPETLQQLSQVLAKDGAIHAFETEIHTGKATRTWVSINAIATKNEVNRPLYEATIEDISERKHSEEALLESRRRLSDIFSFLPDATLVIDKDGRVIAWNRAMETLTGIPEDDMLGRGDREYALPFYGEKRSILIDLALHPDPEMEKLYTAIRREEGIIFGEAYAPHLSPGNIHLSATASVLRDSRGEIIGAIECIRNNTEHKHLEERLSRAEKMEVLGNLAGGVAHDLNNVLGILVGYSELMMMKIPETDPSRRYAVNIRKSGMRGAAIIQDLLTLARRSVAVSCVANLNNVVSEYLKTPEFEKLRDDHPYVTFGMDLDEGLMNIKGSPVHLSKTVMNLVSNAVDAISGRGDVFIKTESRYLDTPIRGYDDVKEGDYAVLTISDTGQGISPQDIDKIFEPFYTKKVMGKSGTGLGLAIVWGTVKDHAGYIEVRSKEGAGSVFTLYFPATEEGLPEEEQPVSLDQYLGAGETILVADDMEGQRELVASMLAGLNYKVIAVSSGEEALSYFQSNQADLLLLDMIMDHGMDGLETYRLIREINPHQKAIIMSGFAETEQVRKALALGAGSYIRKPFLLESLGLAIRKELLKP